MDFRRFIVVSIAVVSVVSCRHVSPLPETAEPASGTAGTAAEEGWTPEQRLAAAESLFQQHEYEAAQDVLAPLLSGDFAADRVAGLAAAINDRLIATRKAALEERKVTDLLQNEEYREELRAAGKALERATRLMTKGRLAEAQECLAPLVGKELFTTEVQELMADINRRRTAKAVDLAQDATADRMMLEVDEHLTLPETYGETVLISPDLAQLDLPPGPMEELVRQVVSMRLDNAGVKDIILELSKIDGLNIVADEALPEPRKLTVSVSDVPLKDLLSYVARNMGLAFHVGENVIWVTKSAVAPGAGPKLETRVYKLRRGFIPKMERLGGLGPKDQDIFLEETAIPAVEDTELEDALKAFLGDGPEGAAYRIFRSRNVLIVRNTREKLRLVEELLKTLDQAPLQVLIEARFITIRQTDLLRFGLNLKGIIVPKTGTTVKFDDLRKRELDDIVLEKTQTVYARETALSASLDEKRLEASGSFPGTLTLSGILGSTTFQAVLDALKEDGGSRTLSVPRITVANNKPAYIFRGRKMYYFEKYELEKIDLGDFGERSMRVPTGPPKELPVGLFLSVTPNIGNDRQTLILGLRPEIKDFIAWEFYDEEGFVKLPIVSEESLATTVVINSGETVVLGGTITKMKSSVDRKLPFFGDLPWIGKLFRETVKEDSPEHLLIFVTAKILQPSGEFAEVE